MPSTKTLVGHPWRTSHPIAGMGKEKRKKRSAELGVELANGEADVNIRKDKKKKTKTKTKELATVSIAVAGSIIDNTQSFELATRVVVFDNSTGGRDNSSVNATEEADENESGALFLIRILKYLETPQYLRRSLFPKHNSLKYVGLLPPLDAPHHLRKHEWAQYREGVTLKEKSSNAAGTWIDVGLSKNVLVDQLFEPGIRVTVAMGSNRNLESDAMLNVVTSNKPREEGLYWGYKVRYANNIGSVFKDCPHKGGYDYAIGTSEHGHIVKSSDLLLPNFRHLLIAFGGLGGLEENFEEDTDLKGKSVHEVFSSYLNTCPYQGSRTIRTEEAIFISLQYFQEPVRRALQS